VDSRRQICELLLEAFFGFLCSGALEIKIKKKLKKKLLVLAKK
jgi:hypothetical protein